MNDSKVITIDGPASSGKSTVGALFAQKIGYHFIDSGSLFRVATILTIRNKISLDKEEEVAKKLEEADIKFSEDGIGIFLNGEDIRSHLHDPEVTALVSDVSAKNEVREAIKNVLRKIGSAQNTVMAGRDIGSVIFREAKLKFYITATPDARAWRRFKQLTKKGVPVKFNELLKDIVIRDKKDATREIAPLVIPKGAVVINTSKMSIEESVEKLFSHYSESLKIG